MPRMLDAVGAPSGFTLTVWGTTALLTTRHGNPGVLEISFFCAGAVLGIAIVATLAGSVTKRPAPFYEPAIHAVAVTVGLSLGFAGGLIPPPVGWAAGGLFGGGGYVLLFALMPRVLRALARG